MLPSKMAEKSTIDQILEHNARFVEEREYEQFKTDKYPDKKLAVVSCMDTRLTALLMAALGLKNGDAKIIKVAGAEVSHPFGSVMRSLLIAVCELGVEDIMIVAHTNCGAQHMSGEGMISMDQSILALYRAGHISLETALDYSDNPDQLRRRLGA